MFEYNCKIVRIVDGDTVDVDIDLGFDVWLKKQRIRLYGVDAPESRTRDLEEKKYGLAAKKFVARHLPLKSQQILRTKLDDARGKFGRILGEFVINQEWEGKEIPSTINALLIRSHHAVEYFGQSKEDIAEQHVKNRELVKL
jgi:micrococcal nuclease